MYISTDSCHHSTIMRTLRDVDVVQLLSQFACIVIDTNIACVYFCLYILHTVLFIVVFCEKKKTEKIDRRVATAGIFVFVSFSHSVVVVIVVVRHTCIYTWPVAAQIFVDNYGLVNSDTIAHRGTMMCHNVSAMYQHMPLVHKATDVSACHRCLVININTSYCSIHNVTL